MLTARTFHFEHERASCARSTLVHCRLVTAPRPMLNLLHLFLVLPSLLFASSSSLERIKHQRLEPSLAPRSTVHDAPLIRIPKSTTLFISLLPNFTCFRSPRGAPTASLQAMFHSKHLHPLYHLSPAVAGLSLRSDYEQHLPPQYARGDRT